MTNEQAISWLKLEAQLVAQDAAIDKGKLTELTQKKIQLADYVVRRRGELLGGPTHIDDCLRVYAPLQLVDVTDDEEFARR